MTELDVSGERALNSLFGPPSRVSLEVWNLGDGPSALRPFPSRLHAPIVHASPRSGGGSSPCFPPRRKGGRARARRWPRLSSPSRSARSQAVYQSRRFLVHPISLDPLPHCPNIEGRVVFRQRARRCHSLLHTADVCHHRLPPRRRRSRCNVVDEVEPGLWTSRTRVLTES